ncbi:MAG: hypothetical protein ACXVRV_14525 [Gaiellaceae bacterium]
MRYAARRPRASRNGTSLRQARRTANRRQVNGDLRCECVELGCRAAIPASAEGHRGMRDGFLVVPGHHGADLVVAAADRFFVVEPKRIAGTS